MNYNGLYSLIEQNERAKNYFNSLPDYVKDTISERADNICSEEALQDYAENLLRGDNWFKK